MLPQVETTPTISSSEETVVEYKGQLVDYLKSGCKPREAFKIGAEQERFVFHTKDFSPVSYDGQDPGIKALLIKLQDFGWHPVIENGQPIALFRGESAITLEPGGQIELSGAPVTNIHQIYKEGQAYHSELYNVGQSLGLSFLSIGHQPKHAQSELPWMPKQRYEWMQSFMLEKGSLGLSMMQSTCAIHVNMDFSSEADMVKKIRLASALQPLVNALFTNSPFLEGKPSGYLSYRKHIWKHTDADRCGNLPFVFDQDMGFERYTNFALDVSMYFVIRDGKYIDANGCTFRDFLAGKLPALFGQKPLLSDWSTHLSTVFTDVRLKQYLEIRGADAGDSSERVAALSALWTGLLYDPESLDEAWEGIKKWNKQEYHALDLDISKYGLHAKFQNKSVQELCLWMLDLSLKGLERRKRKNQEGKDESFYIRSIQEVARKGQTFSEKLLERYENEWDKDINIALRSMCKETLL